VGGPGVLLLTDRLNRIRVVNPVGHYAVVEAGVVNAQINNEVKQYGLFYAPDPASSKFSSIGGNVGTNAGGFKCAKYGVTRGSLLSLTVVLANGDIIETGKPVLKNVAGFDLTSLFTGSEGLLGVVVDATVRLRPIAGQERTVIAFFGDLQGAGLAIEGVLATAVQPAALELMAVPFEQTYSNKFVAAVGNAQWMLVARTDGYGADAELKILAERLREYTQSVILPSESEAESFFIIRDTGRAFPRDSAWVASSDVGVPLDRLPQTFTKLESLAASREAKLIIMAHVADGNLHTGFVLKKTEAESKFPQTLDEARREFIEFVLGVGGTVTGEHGVGRELKEFLPAQLGTANLNLQKTLKKLWILTGS
jgi:glycolate oxidase